MLALNHGQHRRPVLGGPGERRGRRTGDKVFIISIFPLCAKLKCVFKKENYCVGLYRTRDSISNFRLRVRIRRAASSSVASSSSVAGSASAEAGGGGGGGGGGGSSESVRSSVEGDGGGEVEPSIIDEVVVAWQQKIFNEKEFK